MSFSTIRFSLLGLGRAGTFHLQSIRLLEDAVLDAVYDTDREKAASVAEQHGCRVARDADEAVDHPSVDAVIVATPTDSHEPYVRRALHAGKPVFTEKPLGRSLEEIDRSFEASSTLGLPLFVAFQRRFDASFAALVSAVREGRLGNLRFVRSVSRDNPVPSLDYLRISGGIFHDCAVHDLDMILQVTGEKPSRLACFASSFLPGIGAMGDFDNVAATLSFPSGVVSTLDISRQGAFGYDQRLEAFGDAGMLQAENQHVSSLLHATVDGIARSPIEHSFPSRYRDAYVAELACFCRCVRGEQEVPIRHDDVRTNFLLATGLELAAREGRVVSFEEIEKHPSVRRGS